MLEKRSTYHHGDLRAALIQAADAIIAEGGLEAFSLRAAAKRAGVSAGAPAHHFGSARGLLTEVALLAFERMGQYLEKVGHSDSDAATLRALALAMVKFALDHPGHFRLMFRGDLVNREDPRYLQTAVEPGMRLSQAVAAYYGASEADTAPFKDAADVFGGMATLHGLANLVLERKAAHFFQNTASEEFADRELPRVLERMYPDKDKKQAD